MVKVNASDKEQALTDRLRSEAVASRPEFSAALHRQLCSAVRRSEATKPAADPIAKFGWLLHYKIATATAAIVLLAATVFVWQSITNNNAARPDMNSSLANSDAQNRQPLISTLEGANGPTVESTELEIMGELADRATEEIDILVDAITTPWHWNYLNENAKPAYEALNERVPLDAAASLVFADALTDSPWDSPAKAAPPP
jgi:hypothetical protein